MHLFQHCIQVGHVSAVTAFWLPALLADDPIHFVLRLALDFGMLSHNEEKREDCRDGLRFKFCQRFGADSSRWPSTYSI